MRSHEVRFAGTAGPPDGLEQGAVRQHTVWASGKFRAQFASKRHELQIIASQPRRSWARRSQKPIKPDRHIPDAGYGRRRQPSPERTSSLPSTCNGTAGAGACGGYLQLLDSATCLTNKVVAVQ